MRAPKLRSCVYRKKERKKKRKARALLTHILFIPYVSRQICNRKLWGQSSAPFPTSTAETAISYTQKRRLQQCRATCRTLHQTARALRAVRRITRRLFTTLSSVPIKIRINWWYYRCAVLFPRVVLRMKSADWVKAGTAVTILYKIIKTQHNQPQLHSYDSSITCSAGIPLTRN